MHLNVPTVDHSILLSKFLLRYPRSSGFLRTFVELRVQTKQIESYSSVKRVGFLKAPCCGYYFLHCQKFGSKWRTRVRVESLMAAKSCKEMYGISTKIQNSTTTCHNIP